MTVARPGVVCHPTDCHPVQLTVAIGSGLGASAPVQSPFQSSNCAALKFAPKFTAATSGKTSKAKGASLSVKIAYPKSAFGTCANLAKEIGEAAV